MVGALGFTSGGAEYIKFTCNQFLCYTGLVQYKIMSFIIYTIYINIYCGKIYIYHFNHFKVYNSVALSIFTMLRNYHHYSSPKCFQHANRNSVPIKGGLLVLASPQSLVTSILLSVSTNLTTPGTSQKSHMIFILLYHASFT